MTYSEKLKNPRWQKKRLKILDRDNFTCTLCGDTETTLHVHHGKYEGEPWETKDEDLKTHCEHCHCLVEFIKNMTDFDTSVSYSRVIKLSRSNNDNILLFICAVFNIEDIEYTAYHFFEYEEGVISYKMGIGEKSFNDLIKKLNAKN